MQLIRVEHLCKTYPSFTLSDVGFVLEEGRIMGFIGRNGAGKTTALKAMLNFIPADSGRCVINGFDIRTDERAVKDSIGFIDGSGCFYRHRRLRDIIAVTRRFYSEWDDGRCGTLMRRFGLDDGKTVKSLSAGMRVKFQLALALCHNARLLILDEPTSGLDPVSRDELVQLFQNYVSGGTRSILFSTHIISDLEKCADDITYIQNGAILESADVRTFKESYRLVSGESGCIGGGLRGKIIGLSERRGEFEGMIRNRDAELFAQLPPSQPSLEEIMIHIERGNPAGQP
ncbi:MAG: ABC transporter ATP-binding protein [Treponemataceae bacterium]|nr:ABC transporter ATP-binding protein [Treponemataceae bacterium]